MFYAYFLFMPFHCALERARRAFGDKGTLQKVEGLQGWKLHNFDMYSCAQKREVVKARHMAQVRRTKGEASSFPIALCLQGREEERKAHS